MPYETEKERNYREYLENKQKWLVKKGFYNKVGKVCGDELNQISNYVTVTKTKIPLNDYKFRDVYKDRWISNKDFLYRHPHDMLI
jgi:hypothetical protein